MSPRRLSGCLLAPFLALGSLAANAADKAWQIDQEDRLGGERSIYASSRGLRIESKQSRVTIVSSPPEWKVATCSDTKKIYCDCPVDKFVNMLSKPIAVVYGVNLAGIPLKKKGAGTKCGVATVVYDTPFALGIKEFWNSTPSQDGSHRLPLNAHAEFVESFKLPDAESSIMSRLLGLPKEPGLPLVFEYRDQDKDLKRYLKSFSVREISIDDSKFKVPTGYKRVPTVQEVMRAVDNEDVQNLF